MGFSPTYKYLRWCIVVELLLLLRPLAWLSRAADPRRVGPMHSPTVGSQEDAVSYERGTPVSDTTSSSGSRPRSDDCIVTFES